MLALPDHLNSLCSTDAENGKVGFWLQGEGKDMGDYSMVKISADQAIRLAEDFLVLARECKASRKHHDN